MSVKKTPETAKNQTNLPFADLSRFELHSGYNQIRHDDAQTTGVELLYQFQPGIMLRVIDLVALIDQSGETAIPEKHLCINFKLSSNNALEVEDHGTITIEEGSLWVVYSEHQKKLIDHGVKGQKYLLVMLVCKPDVLLQSPFDQIVDKLPSCLQSVFSGDEFMAERFTMSPDLIQALRILINNMASNVFSRPFLQAKTVELMCLALQNMLDHDSHKERAHVSKREEEAMEKASKLLQENWRDPPAQEELIKILGLGRTRLVKCFKVVHGLSISDFVLNIRMQHAQQLLSQGRLNVTQVAMEVGYEHTSNFVSGFKRQFGITPKTFQKAITQHQLP